MFSTEERAQIESYLARDPLVQAMRESDRHVYVTRRPATEGTQALDPIEVQLTCPACLPSEFARAPLAAMLAADGVLLCRRCSTHLIAPPEDVQDLAALAKAIRDKDYGAYMLAIVTINRRSSPMLGEYGT